MGANADTLGAIGVAVDESVATTKGVGVSVDGTNMVGGTTTVGTLVDVAASAERTVGTSVGWAVSGDVTIAVGVRFAADRRFGAGVAVGLPGRRAAVGCAAGPGAPLVGVVPPCAGAEPAADAGAEPAADAGAEPGFAAGVAVPRVVEPRLAGDGEACGRAPTGVAVTAGFGAAGAPFGVGVEGSGIDVGAGVALRRSLTAWATLGPATTPVTAVLAVMKAPSMPNPIGLLRKVVSMPRRPAPRASASVGNS
jgi:hypothetical protein